MQRADGVAQLGQERLDLVEMMSPKELRLFHFLLFAFSLWRALSLSLFLSILISLFIFLLLSRSIALFLAFDLAQSLSLCVQELLDLVEMMSAKELRMRTMLEEVFPSDMLPPPKP